MDPIHSAKGCRGVFILLCGLAASLAFAACGQSSTTAPQAPTTQSIDAFSGSWHSTATAVVGGACSSSSWTITPTGANAATIAYNATCSGIAVTGTGSATLNGTTLNWTTTGTAANSCPFGLTGTAVPDTTITGDLQITYSGTVCGLPVAGADTLHR